MAVESTTPSGLTVVEHRAAFRKETVGEDVYTPGDPNGVEIVEEGEPQVFGSHVVPSPWDGWPADWPTPLWGGRVEELADTAWMCLDRNSSILSTMPPYLVNAAASLDAEWLHNPDPLFYASWEEFAKQLFWDYQAAGEVFVLGTAYYRTGWPARFHVVPPWFVEADLDGAGLRRYRIGGVDVTADMLHVRYQSTTGDARGHGPLEVGRARLVAAATLMRYLSNFIAGGGVPTSVLEYPRRLTARRAHELQGQWIAARMSSMGLPAVLSGGVTFKPMSLSPKDLALVELGQHTDSRIAVLLGMPPFLVGLPSGGDSMTYKNFTGIFDYHWRAGLRPMATTVMAALSQWALPRGTAVEVNRDEYVKPPLAERVAAYKTLREIVDEDGRPALSVAEIRQLERFGVAAGSETLTSGVLQ